MKWSHFLVKAFGSLFHKKSTQPTGSQLKSDGPFYSTTIFSNGLLHSIVSSDRLLHNTISSYESLHISIAYMAIESWSKFDGSLHSIIFSAMSLHSTITYPTD